MRPHASSTRTDTGKSFRTVRAKSPRGRTNITFGPAGGAKLAVWRRQLDIVCQAPIWRRPRSARARPKFQLQPATGDRRPATENTGHPKDLNLTATRGARKPKVRIRVRVRIRTLNSSGENAGRRRFSPARASGARVASPRRPAATVSGRLVSRQKAL